MKPSTFTLILAAITLPLLPRNAAASPLDFFKKLGYELTHPVHPQPGRKNAKKGTAKSGSTSASKTTQVKRERTDGAPDAAEPGETATPPPQPTATPTPQPSPQQQKSPQALVAPSVSKAEVARTDLPYGVPVPNRPGFVVSPFSPNGGYVDIRGYPSGTAVKDPYTGKVFLTP